MRWWKETVTPNKGGDRGNQYVEAKFQVGNFGRDEAESLTGITAVQVSRWRKKLVDATKYEAELFEAAYKKCMAVSAAVLGDF